jgi:uncharacterized protein (TIGR04255 family)
VEGLSNRPLSLPAAPRVRFDRNFITTAVCELRFPTLLEYETKKPVELQRRLRKTYPHYDTEEGVTLVAPGRVEPQQKHVFRSKKRNWIVAFKPSAIAIETTSYTTFEEFAKRLEDLLGHCRDLIDSDFFTRVGLRYIDQIPIENGDPSGWIRPELIAPLSTFGRPFRYLQGVYGLTESGQYTFRHGIEEPGTLYTLDFDLYEENVELREALPLVMNFNELSFRFFMWAIDDKTRSLLGAATPKPPKDKE